MKYILFVLSFLGFSYLHLESSQSPKDPILELAFDRLEFAEKIVMSPDGKKIAFCLREKPRDIDLNQRFIPDGTPGNDVGSKIFIRNLDGSELKQIGPPDGTNWRPVWSPNAQKLAFYSSSGGKVRLWIYDLMKNTFRQVNNQTIKVSYFPFDYPVWSSDGQSIFVPLSRNGERGQSEIPKDDVSVKLYTSGENGVEEEEIGKVGVYLKEFIAQLATIRVDNGDTEVLVPSDAQYPPSYLKISPSGKWLSYVSAPKLEEDFYHGYFDLAVTRTDGKGQIIPLVENLQTDQAIELEQYQWHPTEDSIIYVEDGNLKLVTFNESSPNSPSIIGKENLDLIANPLLFTKNGKFIVVGAKPFRTEFDEVPQSLYLISLDGGKEIEITLGNRWKFISILKANTQEVWQPIENSVSLLLEEKETGETFVVRYIFDSENSENITEKVLWKGLAKMSNFVSPISNSDMYAYYEDLSTPPNIFRFNSDFSQMTRVTQIDPRLEQIVPPEKVILETAVPSYDGTLKNIQTTILLPKKRKPNEKLPAIVMMYPGIDASKAVRNFAGGEIATPPAFLFLEKGYAVILPELSLGPQGKPGNPLQEMVDSLLPQVYHAVNLGYVDVRRLGIIGHSYGGYGTAGIISRTNLFRAAVATSGLYDLGGMYGEFSKETGTFIQQYLEQGQGRMGAPPWDNILRYIENSPYYMADKINTPILLIHGEKDMGDNVIQSKKMYTALKRLDRQATLAIYPNQGHTIDYWNRTSAIDATKRILDFFDMHTNSEY